MTARRSWCLTMILSTPIVCVIFWLVISSHRQKKQLAIIFGDQRIEITHIVIHSTIDVIIIDDEPSLRCFENAFPVKGDGFVPGFCGCCYDMDLALADGFVIHLRVCIPTSGNTLKICYWKNWSDFEQTEHSLELGLITPNLDQVFSKLCPFRDRE